MKELFLISIFYLFATGCTCQRGAEPDLEVPADSVAEGDQGATSLSDSGSLHRSEANRFSGNERPDSSSTTSNTSMTTEDKAINPAGPIPAGDNMGNYQTYEDAQKASQMTSPQAQTRLADIEKKRSQFQENKNNLPDPVAIYLTHCARCHGIDGRGDGPDEAQLGVVPTNFLEWDLKYGTDIKNIVYSTTYGQSENEMPAYQEILKEDEIWSVAFYVYEWVKNRPAN